jgi:hypothetical protein
MSAVVWANILLALPFLAAFIGVPLWLTFKPPETAPDHAEARAYLHARSALAATPTKQQAQRIKPAA